MLFVLFTLLHLGPLFYSTYSTPPTVLFTLIHPTHYPIHPTPPRSTVLFTLLFLDPTVLFTLLHPCPGVLFTLLFPVPLSYSPYSLLTPLSYSPYSTPTRVSYSPLLHSAICPIHPTPLCYLSFNVYYTTFPNTLYYCPLYPQHPVLQPYSPESTLNDIYPTLSRPPLYILSTERFGLILVDGSAPLPTILDGTMKTTTGTK